MMGSQKSWNLAKLKKKGFIRRVGPDKGGHWRLKPRR